ncbi:MAG: hypothetical protein J3Q66DRAFT_367971 [Benniella sp.]|nr:MAG: hypothetical protein J3Q66DRAFT_367971 [Benniella sp.]
MFPPNIFGLLNYCRYSRITMMFKTLLATVCAAICVSTVSAKVCVYKAGSDTFEAFSNDRRLPDRIYASESSHSLHCSNDGMWCYNPAQELVRACNTEAHLVNHCANIC